MKVCVITCYKDPDYIRARTLRSAVEQTSGAELIVVKNSSKGLMRYAQVLLGLIKVRLSNAPDVYILTFRGYELLLPVRCITAGKPLIYDEFINPIEWAAYEHKKIKPHGFIATLIRVIYTVSLTGRNRIITDTQSHAEVSSSLMNIPQEKYSVVHVGTDESIFYDTKKRQEVQAHEFTVFYYGNMLPLHGISYVINAAVDLRNVPITFVLVGGDESVAEDVAKAVKQGAHIRYEKWVDFNNLPGMMQDADICLAGPFGGTYQSDYVITGKAYQYLAMKRPIIIGKNKESGIFTDKENAMVVDQASSKAISDSIIWAYKHSAELGKIAENGHQLYMSKLSSSVIRRQLKKVLISFN